VTESRTDAGAAGRGHADIAPELRQLAQSILDRLDPAVRLAAARAATGGAGKCQQVWCPVCALAALVNGEQHPLLTVIAEHSVTLLAVIRAIVDQIDRPTPQPPAGPPSGAGAEEATDEPVATSRYQPITVTVED
jgi:hypothetical protein